jgi:hypothetical protein
LAEAGALAEAALVEEEGAEEAAAPSLAPACSNDEVE